MSMSDLIWAISDSLEWRISESAGSALKHTVWKPLGYIPEGNWVPEYWRPVELAPKRDFLLIIVCIGSGMLGSNSDSPLRIPANGR